MKRSEARRYRRHINAVITPLDDANALDVLDLFLPWQSNTDYVIGDRRKHNGKLYRCEQAHTSHDNWTPDATPALWTEISVEEWPEWRQPTGVQDSYPMGAKVTHNEKRWISDVDANVWEPGVYGWHEYVEGEENEIA